MPRKTRTKKKQRGKTKPSITKNDDDPSSILQSIEQADNHIEVSDYTTAQRLYETAIQSLRQVIEKDDGEQTTAIPNPILLLARILGKSGEALAFLGEEEKGRDTFLEAISLLSSSDDDDSSGDAENAHHYEVLADLILYLAQLSHGEDALMNYTKGIQELEKIVKLCDGDSMVDSEEQQSLDVGLIEVRKKLCSAYCSIAELYLTDLCFDPNAESECESSLNKALSKNDGSMPDAYQTMANLRLSQNRGKEASEAILKAYQCMKKGCMSLAKLVGLGPEEEEGIKDEEEEEEEPTELENVEDAMNLPVFEFRLQSVKILLECAAFHSTYDEVEDCKKCSEAAIQILGSLLSENDEYIDVWYLLGCAFLSTSDEQMARYYWEKAAEMLLNAKKGLEVEMKGCFGKDEKEDLEEQIEDVQCQLEALKGKLDGLVKAEGGIDSMCVEE